MTVPLYYDLIFLSATMIVASVFIVFAINSREVGVGLFIWLFAALQSYLIGRKHATGGKLMSRT